MKKVLLLIISLTAVTSMLVGCGCTAGTNMPTATPAPSATQPRPSETVRPTTATPTIPSGEEMIPGTEDTIDPSNGADDGMVDPTAGANENARRSHRRPVGH